MDKTINSLESGNNKSLQPKNKKAKLEQLLISIRSTPNATAKLNKSSITCLLSSTQDKLYAGLDTRKKKFYLTYRVEQDKIDNSALVYDLFREASRGIPCAEITTGTFYTQILINEDIAMMNLLIRRLTEKLEDEDLENSLTRGKPTCIADRDDLNFGYFHDISEIIHYSARENLQWPFDGSFRKTLGFDSVDRLITIGHSQLALTAKSSEQWREHVVPVVMIKNKVHEMAKNHASPKVIAEFLKAHLAILIITKKEAHLLDRQLTESNESLRTSMPEGWQWGQDPLARIKAVGITPRLVHGYEPKSWKIWQPSLLNTIRYWLNVPIIRF